MIDCQLGESVSKLSAQTVEYRVRAVPRWAELGGHSRPTRRDRVPVTRQYRPARVGRVVRGRTVRSSPPALPEAVRSLVSRAGLDTLPIYLTHILRTHLWTQESRLEYSTNDRDVLRRVTPTNLVAHRAENCLSTQRIRTDSVNMLRTENNTGMCSESQNKNSEALELRKLGPNRRKRKGYSGI